MENDNSPADSRQNRVENEGQRRDEHTNPNPGNPEYKTKDDKITVFKILEFLLLVLVFVATATAACYTKKQWEVADKQLGVSRDTEMRQLRSYLYVDHGGFSPIWTPTDPGTPAGVTIFLHAAGATPAYKLRLAATVEIGEFPLPNGKLSDLTKRSGEGITRETYPILYGNEPISEGVTVKFQREALDLFKSTTQHHRFYVFGSVRYFDIFGIEDPKLERRYDFCFSFESDRNSPIKAAEEDACDKYNKPG